MRDVTVNLKRRTRAGTTSQPSTPGSQFQIEVPPHLARELGLCFFTPPSTRVIRCDRPVQTNV
jgi:hypothetical protein